MKMSKEQPKQKPIITMREKALAQWLKEKGQPRPLAG